MLCHHGGAMTRRAIRWNSIGEMENTGLDDFHWQTKQQLLQRNMLHLKATWI